MGMNLRARKVGDFHFQLIVTKGVRHHSAELVKDWSEGGRTVPSMLVLEVLHIKQGA